MFLSAYRSFESQAIYKALVEVWSDCSDALSEGKRNKFGLTEYPENVSIPLKTHNQIGKLAW